MGRPFSFAAQFTYSPLPQTGGAFLNHPCLNPHTMPPPRVILAALTTAMLAACGPAPLEQEGSPLDPVMAEALQGQLMVDPDLTQQDMRNRAIVPGGPIDPALPLPDPPSN